MTESPSSMRSTARSPRFVGGPVVPASELEHWDTGKKFLIAAKRAAQGIISKAKEEAEAQAVVIREQARQEGLQAFAEATAELAATRERFWREHETQIVDLVMATTSKLLGELSDKERLTSMVSRGVQQGRSEPQLTLRVAPEQLDNARAVLEVQEYDGTLSLRADATLDVTQCQLETVHGVIHLGLEEQLERLRTAMQRAITER